MKELDGWGLAMTGSSSTRVTGKEIVDGSNTTTAGTGTATVTGIGTTTTTANGVQPSDERAIPDVH
jgi:hypothetical protein